MAGMKGWMEREVEGLKERLETVEQGSRQREIKSRIDQTDRCIK